MVAALVLCLLAAGAAQAGKLRPKCPEAGDTLGNLIYHGTQRNWNPVMAMAAGISIAEVNEIYEAGELDGGLVVTPRIFVKRIVETN